MEAACELSFVMPCLNEAETLASAVRTAQEFLAAHRIQGEVVVADNGSTDGSAEIARAAGARVISVDQRGYGSSLMGGIAAARGESVIIGDPDGSYDFASVDSLVAKLRDGYDLVVGNRFSGRSAAGSDAPAESLCGQSASVRPRSLVLSHRHWRFPLWFARVQESGDRAHGSADHRNGIRE